jgi:hypothetical protein
MLDAQELKRRVVRAMDEHEPRVTSAALADACKVTPQAVNGWRTTGRIAKRHLAKVAELTGKPLEYFLNADAGALPEHYPIEEAQAMKRLRKAVPAWRNYVLGLALVEDHSTQQLLLNTMRQTVSDRRVEESVTVAPHAAARGKAAKEKK